MKNSCATATTPKTECTKEESKDAAIITTKSANIQTLDDLLRYAQVDLTIWEVDRHVINKWEVAMREPATTVGGAGNDAVISKSKDGALSTLWTRGNSSPIHEALFQVKVWLRRRAGRLVAIESVCEQTLAAIRAHRPRYSVRRTKSSKSGNLLELDLPDLHLGKLCWSDESGQDYDTKIASRLYLDAMSALINRASGFAPERILFVIGNDFYNVDNAAGTTTGGTPQDEDSRWQKTFVAGRKLAVDAIDGLRLIAPVDVVIVAGNHDSERAFYLGDVLSAWYHRDKSVQIDNAPSLRKYYEWGLNLIGFTHGDKEKTASLPAIMAVERPEQWGRTRFREFHLGHVHKKNETQWAPVDEFQGVRVRRLSSLSAADAWHAAHGYRAQRSAEAIVFNRANGVAGQFSYNVK